MIPAVSQSKIRDHASDLVKSTNTSDHEFSNLFEKGAMHAWKWAYNGQ